MRWLSRRKATDIALPGNDFWLFDSRVVLVNHLDGEGGNVELELELSEAPDLAKLCKAAFEAVWQRATPHAARRVPALAQRSAPSQRHDLAIFERPGSGWPLLGALLTLPPVRWAAWGVYRLVANNRQRMPGGTSACALPARHRTYT